MCYYINNVCCITCNTMFLTIEGVEHRFIKINPLLISYSIHMVTFGTSHYQVCHCSNLHRICMMLSSMLHTKCVKSTSCTYWFWIWTNSTTRMIPTNGSRFISPHQFTKLQTLLPPFHVLIFKQSMLMLGWYNVLLFLSFTFSVTWL